MDRGEAGWKLEWSSAYLGKFLELHCEMHLRGILRNGRSKICSITYWKHRFYWYLGQCIFFIFWVKWRTRVNLATRLSGNDLHVNRKPRKPWRTFDLNRKLPNIPKNRACGLNCNPSKHVLSRNRLSESIYHYFSSL